LRKMIQKGLTRKRAKKARQIRFGRKKKKKKKETKDKGTKWNTAKNQGS